MKLSIVIPIYNAERYLKETLLSIVTQDNDDFEIICVDDCSTDRSRNVLEEVKKNSSCIKTIYHKKNEGTLVSRCDGVAAASGDYIMFVDSDDGLLPNACKKLCSYMDSYNVDIICFGTKVIAVDNSDIQTIRTVEQIVSVDNNLLLDGNLIASAFLDKKISVSLWNKIYRTDICKKAFCKLPEGVFVVGEDILATFLLLLYSSKLRCIDEQYYLYRVGCGISTSICVDESRFKVYCNSAVIAQKLKDILISENRFDSNKACWEEYKNNMLGDCINKWKCYLPKEYKAKGFDMLVSSWGAKEVCRYLIKCQNTFDEQAHLADMVVGAKALIAKPIKVKTIGVFYYRLFRGGVERVIASLVKMWVDAGYSVVLLTDKIEDGEYQLPQQVKRCILPNSFNYTPDNLQNRFSSISDAVVSNDIDVFVHNAWQSDALLWDILAVKLCGIPFVQYTHGIFSSFLPSGDLPNMQRMSRMTHIYQLADAIICLSQCNCSFWKYFNNNTHCFSNPCFIDSTTLVESSSSKKSVSNHSIIWVGRMEPEKGLLEAIEIMALVSRIDSAAELHILGKADSGFEGYFALAKARVRELGIDEKVVFEDYHIDMVPYYSSCDVLLSTSIFEGYPMAIAEAKICGLPSVIYELPYIQFAEDGRGMISVSQGDRQAAATAILSLLCNEKKLKSFSEEAKKSAQIFDKRIVFESWERLFRSFSDPIQVEREIDNSEKIMMRTLMEHLNMGISALNRKAQEIGSRAEFTPSGSYLSRKIQTLFFCLGKYGIRETLRIFYAAFKNKSITH